MENSNIIKQAKSDIFKELYTIINFYISKGATSKALKKYYKNNKRLDDIIEDIKSKGSNLVKDEEEYKKLVKQTLDDILDDFIAKEKDDEYKNKKINMKHIKEFNSFENTNESVIGTLQLFAIGFFLWKFIMSIIRNAKTKNVEKVTNKKKHIEIENLLQYIKKIDKIPILELNDRYFIRFEDSSDNTVDIRIMKENKNIKINTNKGEFNLQLSEKEYDEFLNLIKKI